MAQNFEQTEWLNLVDVSGPFLAGKVLEETFPQGLDKIETPRRQHVRAAYDEWDEARDQADPELLALHGAWVRLVLEQALEFESEVLTDRAKGGTVPSYEALAQGEAYSPDFVLRSLQGERLLFVSVYPPGTDLEQPLSGDWVASPIERMTLLCRSEKVRIGLVTNGEEWSLVNAPEGETSGYTTWLARLWWLEPVTFKAFVSLLGVRRFFGPAAERLDSLLQRSLSEHHEVTDTLGQQVRRAVEVLVQALGRADEDRDGELLRGVVPADLYNAGLTVMMRLVFLLCAEERELLLSGDPVYDQHYAISTLRAKLHEESDQHGVEVLERRYDAWSRLLSMFRVVYGGIEHESLRMPAMGGSLFDPDRFPFLEGRARRTSWRTDPASPLPIDNRTVMLLLQALQVLEHRGGARQLSYRGLDVEQIGHVYEGLLEYKVERVSVVTLGLIGSKDVARPTMALHQLEALVRAGGTKATSTLAELTGRSAATLAKALERQPAASDLPALVHASGGDEAIARRVLPFAALLAADSWGVPLVYRAGSFAVTLGSGRRESGAHYTPKALTEPIVATTLRPILEAMGEHPSPERLLALKVCDPAMGSGAFLVETCRQLGAHVVEAWTRAERAGHCVTVHGEVVDAEAGQELLSAALADRIVRARRLVSDRCLYGVDKNPMAVDLAKLSIWLLTLAKGRPLGFLDHKLKHGDSLVGLTKSQIGAFHWSPPVRDFGPLFNGVTATVDEVSGLRRQIQDLDEGNYDQRQVTWNEAEGVVHDVRLIGDLCIAAYFGAQKDKDREVLRLEYRRMIDAWRVRGDRTEAEGIVEELRGGERPVPPLHWEVEFPEVFGRENPGFDAVVGNPPFLGGSSISSNFGPAALHWLLSLHPESHGNADLVAHFYRRAFSMLRESGCFGLIATNTIGQGDTRATGLRWVGTHGGEIYSATRRVKWPGQAAVVVSVVHTWRGAWPRARTLDGRAVPFISAFLFHGGGHDDPHPLAVNAGKSFLGSKVYGQGFTFDDTDKSDAASPLAEMHRLIAAEPRNAERIFPYIGGEEVNSNPTHANHRYVINFGEMTELEARNWPELLAIVEAKVKPARLAQNREIRARYWWRFGETTPALFRAIAGLERVYVTTLHTHHFGIRTWPLPAVFSHGLAAFAIQGHAAFCSLQAYPHELWARFFGSSLGDALRYTPSDCFETFPFPQNWQTDPALEATGQTYYDFRAALMVQNNEGLTKTYNRFHDPSERDPDILRLRELHAAMDRAVLDAYGWTDVPTDCDFFLDYEIDEETWGDKKKPYRYRWPDGTRDEVLARLLELNQKRYQAEVAAGLHGGTAKGSPAPAKKKTAAPLEPPRSPQPPPRVVPKSPPADLLQLGTAELVALGTAEARRELKRRGRDPITGRKSAQEKLL